MILIVFLFYLLFFFFNDPATTEIYTLSLHDALPIYVVYVHLVRDVGQHFVVVLQLDAEQDRKSTRLNSSHSQISYAVFCLKKKKIKDTISIIYMIMTNI